MSLTIRKIEKDDYNEVEVLTREAFWNIYRPPWIYKGIRRSKEYFG